MASRNEQKHFQGGSESAIGIREQRLGVVDREKKPRQVQKKTSSFVSSLNNEWCDKLDIDSQSAPVDHFLITGQQPVIINEPGIVILPARGSNNEQR